MTNFTVMSPEQVERMERLEAFYEKCAKAGFSLTALDMSPMTFSENILMSLEEVDPDWRVKVCLNSVKI